jgi:galactose-1-phosphate uridylyltransferase
MAEEKLQEQSCLFHTANCRNKGHNSDKLAWVRFLTNMFSVDRKLSMTEEWHQDQFHLFWQENYRSKGHSTVNLSYV